MVEIVPPNPRVSGLMVNPLVSIIKQGGGALVSLKYNSKFRDLTHAIMSTLSQPLPDEKAGVAGLVNVNKKLAARLEARKKQAAEAAPPEPKGKAAAAKAPPAKEAAPPAKAAGKQKGGPTAEEEAAEAERIKREAEEAERLRLEELERNFDKHGELQTMGGKVMDFDRDDENKRSQHYEWLIPVYYRVNDRPEAEINCFYLEARTTTVKRTLIPNVSELEFGEIPVAFKQVQEILVKNVGNRDETLKMEALTPFGGFSVLNAMRTIRPGETKAIVVQFEPLSQQIYEERAIIYSDSTMVSVLLKGTGVRPEVTISPEDGLLQFPYCLVGETVEKQFTISNVSNFAVNFNLLSKAIGVDNLQRKKPFLFVPSQGTIQAKSNYVVKVVFQPDHPSNEYFDMFEIDIPNQINAKRIFIRGWAYSRQFFVREHKPFIWKTEQELKKRYEEPLQMLQFKNA